MSQAPLGKRKYLEFSRSCSGTRSISATAFFTKADGPTFGSRRNSYTSYRVIKLLTIRSRREMILECSLKIRNRIYAGSANVRENMYVRAFRTQEMAPKYRSFTWFCATSLGFINIYIQSAQFINLQVTIKPWEVWKYTFTYPLHHLRRLYHKVMLDLPKATQKYAQISTFKRQ